MSCFSVGILYMYAHSGVMHMLLLFFCVFLLSFTFLDYSSDFCGLYCSIRRISESLNVSLWSHNIFNSAADTP